jgi:hypothetical protein
MNRAAQVRSRTMARAPATTDLDARRHGKDGGTRARFHLAAMSTVYDSGWRVGASPARSYLLKSNLPRREVHRPVQVRQRRGECV